MDLFQCMYLVEPSGPVKYWDSLRFSNLRPILLYLFQVVRGNIKAKVGRPSLLEGVSWLDIIVFLFFNLSTLWFMY